MAHVAQSYPEQLRSYPSELMALVERHAMAMHADLRRGLVKALMLLRTKGRLEATEVLPLFFRLFRVSDKTLRTMLFRHVVADIRAINKRHRQDAVNRQLQAFLFAAVHDANEAAVKRALAVLIELYRRNVWTDERSVNVIATAAHHKSPRVSVAALNFFMGVGMGGDGEDSDDEDDEDGAGGAPGTGGIKGKGANKLSKNELYKAFHTGTASSRRKKQKKLERAVRSASRAERVESGEALSAVGISALELLRDPHTFAEKVFKRLQGSREKFETKMLMVQVVSRTITVHRLVVLPFYPFIARYLQPQQRDVTRLLTAAAEATHDQVPPDAIEPVLRQVVNAFVHDRSRPEAMGVGLKTVHALCLRCPLVMTEELLRDLTAYKKDKDKGVRMASRSLIGLFRELAPALLDKKDRGRGHDKTRAIAAFGEAKFAEGVAGAELLAEDERRRAAGLPGLDEEDEDSDGWESASGDDDDDEGGSGSEEEEEEDAEAGCGEDKWETDSEAGSEGAEEGAEGEWRDIEDVSDEDNSGDENEDGEEEEKPATAAAPAANPKSLRSLRKALKAGKAKADGAASAADVGDADVSKEQEASARPDFDRLLTQEDFERIRELRASAVMGAALDKVGLKRADPQAGVDVVPKRVREESLYAQGKRATDKAARLATVLAGREGREFESKAARSNAKTGGLTNAQQRKRKQANMPLGAVRQAGKRAKRIRARASKARERGFGGRKAYK